MTKKTTSLFIFILLLAGAAFYGGFYYGQSQVPAIYGVEGLGNKTLGQPDDADFSLFWDAWKTVQEKYVDRSKLNKKEMVYGAIEGMVKSLKDPYTVFFKPVESKQFLDDVSGSFSGIGAEIGIRKDILTVISPLENSPAQQAGLRAGDRILKINDDVTADMTVNQAVNLIRGPKDSVVKLTISRPSNDEVKEINITRGDIKIPTIKWELKEGKIAYIQLFNFGQTAPSEFRNKILEVLRGSADRIILDLRNNPGGYLEVSQDIAGWFMEPGSVVAIEDFGNGAEDKEYRASGNGVLKNIPMVVLINEGSASASEILAGALRDNRKVKLIGAKSFGKGSVQELSNLREGTSLKVTIAKWLTPSGKSINGEGLEPDIKVEITKEDIEGEKDPQLERSVQEVLKL
ncbi:MAG: S41 family peptidase [Candidatus Sungbacteria bacterium]|uniref:S41 family peptidase n=1 Tax=Candidatus Sungiibacteriota bacterium TaxID=2750080 RepID=A0A932DS77_9BACT|nr:S41 family peptidase [Candidatus Sungbacteria bacterium]